MTTTRRILTLAGLVLAVIIGSTIPASATFADSAAVTTSISTLTVQAPTNLTVNDYCVTTTVTTKQTVYTNPGTGASTTTYYNQTTSTATSTSNVQGTTTTQVAGPGPNEVTTTTVSKNTNLYVTLSWTASPSPRVTGYVVSAYLGINGTTTAVTSTTGTSTSQSQDADNLYYQPSLYVTTQTAYGWTADSVRTAPISC